MNFFFNANFSYRCPSLHSFEFWTQLTYLIGLTFEIVNMGNKYHSVIIFPFANEIFKNGLILNRNECHSSWEFQCFLTFHDNARIEMSFILFIFIEIFRLPLFFYYQFTILLVELIDEQKNAINSHTECAIMGPFLNGFSHLTP